MNVPTKEKLFKQIILENIKDNPLTNIVDATCGNGYDLEFLSTNYIKSNIWALDIQSLAIENSKLHCNEIKEDIKYIQIDHLEFFKNTQEMFDLVIFNTGYLPGSNSKVSTSGLSTVKTLECALIKIRKNGMILIMLYTGHDEYAENNEVGNYLNKLNKYEYIVFKYETINVKNSPILYIIEKK